MGDIKIVHNSDTNKVNYNDLNIKSDISRFVQSEDLKTNQYSSNNGSMRPNLNEEIHRPEPNSNFKILENDINLLANKKKTKNFSSSEEESSSVSSVISTEASEDESIPDATATLGRIEDEEDDDEYTHQSDGSETSSDGGNEGTLTSTSQSSRRSVPMRTKTPEEIAQEKQELIYRLERLEQSGFKPSRKYTMSSNLEEIRSEYERLKKQRDVDKSIKFQRKILMAVTSGVEFLNGKFDPIGVKLDGWSESIYENLHDYDEVFEELNAKYKEKVKVAPEIKLLMMVGGSAFMFHLTNTLFKSKMPGLGDILQQNPDLARNVQQAAMNTMRQNEAKSGNPDPLFNMMMNQAQNMMGPKRPTGPGPMGPGVKEMRGPSGVDDILSMVNNRTPARPSVPEDKEESISSVSSQESGTRRRIKMKKTDGSGKKHLNFV